MFVIKPCYKVSLQLLLVIPGLIEMLIRGADLGRVELQDHLPVQIEAESKFKHGYC